MTRRFRFIIPRHRSEPSSFQVILSIRVIIPSHRLRENGGVGGTYRTLRYVIGIGYVTEIGRAAGAGPDWAGDSEPAPGAGATRTERRA